MPNPTREALERIRAQNEARAGQFSQHGWRLFPNQRHPRLTRRVPDAVANAQTVTAAMARVEQVENRPSYYHTAAERRIAGYAARYPSIFGNPGTIRVTTHDARSFEWDGNRWPVWKPEPIIKKCGGVDDEDNGEYIRYE